MFVKLILYEHANICNVFISSCALRSSLTRSKFSVARREKKVHNKSDEFFL